MICNVAICQVLKDLQKVCTRILDWWGHIALSDLELAKELCAFHAFINDLSIQGMCGRDEFAYFADF